jgi:hypothetical protein
MRFTILALGTLAALSALPAQARDGEGTAREAKPAATKTCEVRNIHFLGKLAKVDRRVICTEASSMAKTDAAKLQKVTVAAR